MNFAQALQIKGQKDGRGYDEKVTMLARFGAEMQFGQTKENKPKCSVKLTDKDNVTHKVYLYGTLPTAAMCTQRAEFSIAAFDGQGQQGAYVGYSGFWNSSATIVQDGQSQGQQPAAKAPAQLDATGISIQRQAAWKSACEVTARRSPMSLDETEEWALRGSQFMTDGQLHPSKPKGPAMQPSGPNPDYNPDGQEGDELIPF